MILNDALFLHYVKEAYKKNYRSGSRPPKVNRLVGMANVGGKWVEGQLVFPESRNSAYVPDENSLITYVEEQLYIIAQYYKQCTTGSLEEDLIQKMDELSSFNPEQFGSLCSD